MKDNFRSSINNRIKKVSLLLMVMFVGFALYGCAQNPVASTTATTTPPFTFCGVSLGMTEAQVIAAKGTPSSRDTTTSATDTVLFYDGTDTYFIIKNSTGVVRSIVTYKSGYTILGFGIGDSETAIKAIIGEPTTGSSPMYWWNTTTEDGQKITLYIYFTTSNKAFTIQIWPDWTSF